MAVPCQGASINQSKCFISAWCSYAIQKFVYDIGTCSACKINQKSFNALKYSSISEWLKFSKKIIYCGYDRWSKIFSKSYLHSMLGKDLQQQSCLNYLLFEVAVLPGGSPNIWTFEWMKICPMAKSA